jgi:hypothetical protein
MEAAMVAAVLSVLALFAGMGLIGYSLLVRESAQAILLAIAAFAFAGAAGIWEGVSLIRDYLDEQRKKT